MEAYKCDMCKRYFDSKAYDNVKEWEENGNKMKIHVSVIKNSIYIDICLNCLRKTLHEQFKVAHPQRI